MTIEPSSSPQTPGPAPARGPSPAAVRRATLVAAVLFALFCLWFAFLWTVVLRQLPAEAPTFQTAMALLGLGVSLGGAALMGYVAVRTVKDRRE